MTETVDIERARVTEVRRRPEVLVAVAFDAASEIALVRGAEVAQELGARLHVVHVLPREHDFARDPMTRALETYVARVLGPGGDVRAIVRVGNPVAEIWREAHALAADLLVVGGAVDGPPGFRARFLAQHARRPVLLAASPHARSVVAATDLRDRRFPVVRWAAHLAHQAGLRLGVVHNVLPRAPRELDVVRAEIHSDVTSAVDEPEAEAAPISVTTAVAAADGILAAAVESDADMVVVGARETSARTLHDVAMGARRSVLAVPLRRRGPERWPR